MCDYAGYATALISRNFSAYLSATDSTRFVDVAKCAAASSLTRDAFTSFVSGHAGLAFAGCVFTALLIRHVARIPAWDVISPRAMLAGWPIVLAAYVALTRIFNRCVGVAYSYGSWHQVRHHLQVSPNRGRYVRRYDWHTYRDHGVSRLGRGAQVVTPTDLLATDGAIKRGRTSVWNVCRARWMSMMFRLCNRLSHVGRVLRSALPM